MNFEKRQSRTTRVIKQNIVFEGKRKVKKKQGRAVLSKEAKTEGNMGQLHGCKSRGATRNGNKSFI